MVLTEAHLRESAANYLQLAKEPEISIQLATILMAISRTCAGLADQKARLDEIAREEDTPCTLAPPT